MKRLYEDTESQQQQSSAPVRDSQDDADLVVHPFGSTTQSDQPLQGRLVKLISMPALAHGAQKQAMHSQLA